VLLIVYLERLHTTKTEGEIGGERSSAAWAPHLLPLSVALLVAGSQGYDFNLLFLPAVLLLGVFSLERENTGSPGVRRQLCIGGVTLAVLLAYTLLVVAHTALRSTVPWTMRWYPALAETVYGALPAERREAYLQYARSYEPSNARAWLPEDVRRAMEVIQTVGVNEAYCFPYPLLPALGVVRESTSAQDYWAEVYVTEEEAREDIQRLEASDCQWVLIRRWELSFGPWRQVRERHIEDRSLSAGARLMRDFPSVMMYLENHPSWQPVMREYEVQLWHRAAVDSVAVELLR